jgi:hypothetical protein
MANSKISALPSATTPLAGTEVLPIVQGGITEQVSVANLTAGRAVSATELTLTTGNLIVSNGQGIDFSATPGTGTSELFNDYEEGTYTPTFFNFTLGNGTINSAVYRKIGSVIYCSGRVTLGSTSSVTGSLRVSPPFAGTSTGLGGGGGTLFDSGTASYYVAIFLGPYTSANMFFSDGTGAGEINATNPFTWTTNDAFAWSIVYALT